MIWKHIDFYFKDGMKYQLLREKPTKLYGIYYLNKENQLLFEECLRDIITSCRLFIRRKFYLYEDIPHCFLALEIKNKIFCKGISSLIKKLIRKYDFIESAELNDKKMLDEKNGEDFLMILDAFTEAYLFHRSKIELTHIVHCCMEFIHQDRLSEVNFYKKMVKIYG